MLRAATERLLVGSPILTVSLKVLPILMPITSIGLEIMTISLPILAIASYIPTIALEIMTVVTGILPVLLELSGAGPSVFITLQLLPALTKGPLVLPHILTVCSHVSVALPKIAAVPLKVLPILAAIPPVLSHVLTILAEIRVREARLCIGGTAAHDCRQHSDFENSP
jgi:hypothetical protein